MMVFDDGIITLRVVRDEIRPAPPSTVVLLTPGEEQERNSERSKLYF